MSKTRSSDTGISLKLPLRIISRRDVLEAAREFEELRDNQVAISVKKKDLPELEPSERARALLEENNYKSLSPERAEKIAHDLQELADRAPMLRFVFAGEPSSAFMGKLIKWVRSNIDASALVIFSIQPQIAGGYILTTDTRRHDMSWRKRLNESPIELGKLLRGDAAEAAA